MAEPGGDLAAALTIEVTPFAAADAAGLADAANRELRSRYGPFGAPPPLPSDFEEPNGVFLVARQDGRAVACGGMRRLEDGVAEIRRMYTVPELRGRGLAARLLRQLEIHARRFGYRAMRLETGWLQPDALSLYVNAGYRVIPCYGEFNDRESVCMEKTLVGG